MPVDSPASPSLNLPKKRATNRAGNKDGVVFIAEYHHIREGKTTMERSPAEFRKDLERMYRLGFRPINATEYLTGSFDLPPGASPVVITFDDAHPSQIVLDAKGKLDPNCGLGIMEKFSKEHPDFPPKAVFFVLPQLWGQPSHRMAKVELVHRWGGEIANHTVSHPNLGKLGDQRVMEEIAGAFELLAPYRGKPEYLALPLGIAPKNKTLLRSFSLDGKQYSTQAVFLVGANPAPTPGSKEFDSLRIPRIQACAGPFGLDDWLGKVENGRCKPYVAP